MFTPTYLSRIISLFQNCLISIKYFIRKQCYSQLLYTKEIFTWYFIFRLKRKKTLH